MASNGPRLQWLAQRRRREAEREDDISSSSSAGSLEELAKKFEIMDTIDDANNNPDSAYRGFSTSISQFFVNPAQEQGDACALACCGMFQKDRNQYLLTGEAPRSCKGAFVGIVGIPVVLASTILALLWMETTFEAKHSHTIAIALFCVLSVYITYLAVTAIRKRVEARRELLRQKYGNTGSSALSVEQNGDNDDQADVEYMRGQTTRDLLCAHLPCGCYDDDIIFEDMEAPPSKDFCGEISKCVALCCCGRFGGCYIQLCGICGVAQETRDLDNLVPPSRSAVDYMTMQPVLEYYSNIIALRKRKNWNLVSHIAVSSRLSYQILQSFLLGLATFILMCIVFRFPQDQLGMMVTLFTASNFFMWTIYWPFIWHLSADAVIKCFAAGFCIASTMALFFESIVALTAQGIIFLAMHTQDDGSFKANAAYADDDAYGVDSYGAPFLRLNTGINESFSESHPFLYFCFQFLQCFFVGAFIEEIMKYLAFRMLASHPDFWSQSYLEKVLSATGLDKNPIVNLSSLPKIEIGAQERTLQSRCLAIIIAMVAVSIGFSCCETLVYIFVFHTQEVDWTTMTLRLFLLSVHPVCAAWQAVGVCRRDVERNGKYQLGRILLPAIIWHGLFDFAFVVGDYLMQRKKLSGDDEDGYKKALLFPGIVLLIAFIFLVVACVAQQMRLNGRTEEWLEDHVAWSWKFIPTLSGKQMASSAPMKPYETETGVELTGGSDAVETTLLTSPVAEIKLPFFGSAPVEKKPIPSLLYHAYAPPELRGVVNAPTNIQSNPSNLSSVIDSCVSCEPHGFSYDKMSFGQPASVMYEAARQLSQNQFSLAMKSDTPEVVEQKRSPGKKETDGCEAFGPSNLSHSASDLSLNTPVAMERVQKIGLSKSAWSSEAPMNPVPAEIRVPDDADEDQIKLVTRVYDSIPGGGISEHLNQSSKQLTAAMDLAVEAAANCATPYDHESVGPN